MTDEEKKAAIIKEIIEEIDESISCLLTAKRALTNPEDYSAPNATTLSSIAEVATNVIWLLNAVQEK
tara:strand:- start:903 stop:1103 length:201 start_codon:yes stop_codon:yes gene_type:complete